MGATTKIETTDGAFDAYVARPASGQGPAIIVIQEIFGVNQVMRDLTDAYAGAGYWAICPDLFWRIEPGIDITDKSEAEWKRAFELFNAFNVDNGIKDIAAAIAFARRSGAAKVGAVGYCLGGLLAYLTATRTDAEAAVSYYGVGIERHLSEAQSSTAPLMLHIAAKDQFVPEPAQQQIIAALTDRPKTELHLYPERDHAFARIGGEHYNAADAALAEARTLDFFAANLKA
jgi:carboxymethylenebutenolidase